MTQKIIELKVYSVKLRKLLSTISVVGKKTGKRNKAGHIEVPMSAENLIRKQCIFVNIVRQITKFNHAS